MTDKGIEKVREEIAIEVRIHEIQGRTYTETADSIILKLQQAGWGNLKEAKQYQAVFDELNFDRERKRFWEEIAEADEKIKEQEARIKELETENAKLHSENIERNVKKI